MTDDGIIYCPPCNRLHGILKIDTNTDNVTELDRHFLPEQDVGVMGAFISCQVMQTES